MCIRDRDGSDWEISFFHSLPVKYSFYKTVYYEEGDELRIITNSRDPHVIDVFYTEGGGLSRYNPAYQHLSWLVPSELSSNNQQKIYISFKEIRIPKTGYYTIKKMCIRDRPKSLAQTQRCSG